MSLRTAFDSPGHKRAHNQRLFATIADRYDLITRVLSFGQDQRWKARLMREAQVTLPDCALDLACGTGDIAFAVAAAGVRTIGLDLTPRMLHLARDKQPGSRLTASDSPPSPLDDARDDPEALEGSRPEGPPLRRDLAAARLDSRRAEAGRLPTPVSFVCGDMGALPFPAARFDLVTTGYGLRNVPDIDRAIGEIVRVLRPGGRLLSLDFNRPASPAVRTAYLAYLTVVGSLLGWLLHRDPDTYRYIPESIRRYPGAQGVADRLSAAGFAEVRVVRLLGGLMALHVARLGPDRRG